MVRLVRPMTDETVETGEMGETVRLVRLVRQVLWTDGQEERHKPREPHSDPPPWNTDCAGHCGGAGRGVLAGAGHHLQGGHHSAARRRDDQRSCYPPEFGCKPPPH